MICAHAYTGRKNGVVKEAIERFESSRVTSNVEKSDGVVHCSVQISEENEIVAQNQLRQSTGGDQGSYVCTICEELQ